MSTITEIHIKIDDYTIKFKGKARFIMMNPLKFESFINEFIELYKFKPPMGGKWFYQDLLIIKSDDLDEHEIYVV